MCKDGKQSCWHQRYYGNEYVCTVPVFMRLFSIFRKVYHSLSMIVTWSTTMCVCPPCLSIRLGNGNWGVWTTCTPLKARIVCRLLRFSLYLTDMIHQKRLRTGEAQGRKNGNSCFIRHVKKKMNLLQQFHINTKYYIEISLIFFERPWTIMLLGPGLQKNLRPRLKMIHSLKNSSM